MSKSFHGSLIAGSLLVLLFSFQNCGSDQGNSYRPSIGGGNFQNDVGAPVSKIDPSSYARKEIIVKMNSDKSHTELVNWARSEGLTLKAEWKSSQMSNWGWDSDPTTMETIEALKSLSFSEDIMYAEPNYMLNIPTPSSSLPDEVQALSDELGTLSFSQSDVGGFQRRSKNGDVNDLTGVSEYQGQGDPSNPIIVAVVDTGLDVTHRTFIDNNALWVNTGEIPGDGIDNDGNGFVDDINGYNFADGNSDLTDIDGHGTHCGGIVLNSAFDIFANTTVESPLKIMGLKFIGQNSGRTSDAIRSIQYAMDNGARVISNSWGGPGFSRALKDVMDEASNKGVVLLAAAGNDGANNDEPSSAIFPASLDSLNLISVAASDSEDDLAGFSNFGESTVDLSAPGVFILSTYPSVNGESKFNYLSGTSMATPYVAGTAAMMLNKNSDLTGFEIKQLLLENTDGVAEFDDVLSTGGRLSFTKSFEKAKETTSTGFQPQVQTSGESRDLASNSSSSSEEGGGGCGMVAPNGGTPPSSPMGLIFILMLPLMVFGLLKSREPRASFGHF